MSSIVAVNQTYLCDPRLDGVLSGINQLDRKMLAFFCNLSLNMGSVQLGLMSRAGVNIFPFNNNILPMINSVMPKFASRFDLTWDEITDQRAADLQLLALAGKKLIVFWSGGIDSTCILASVLKNFDPVNLSQVTVACTCDSIVENPVFYHRHILPNFAVVDTNWFAENRLLKDPESLIVDGYAADTLTMSMTPSLDVCMAVRDADLLTCSWRRPDALIKYLHSITGSLEFAHWYYDRTRESVESVDVPIETYFDFMWWIGFNCEYYAWAVHSWFFCYRHMNIDYAQFQSRNIGWYRTDAYQLWAMKNNGAGVKHGSDLGSFKKHPKKYIYDYDHNEYYWRYKTKVNSAGRNYNSTPDKPFAITDSFDILYLNKDLDKILQLLPSHIRS